jgi:hypothetical protein
VVTTVDAEILQTQERLQRARRAQDFDQQLAAYKDLARLWNLQRAHDKAADSLEKAEHVADYLGKPSEIEAIYLALIATYEDAGDYDGQIRTYGLLHIHWNLVGNLARALQYNETRLKLVAQQIGKKSPSSEERFKYEFDLASRELRRSTEQCARLVSGAVEPTVPDEHVEACRCLVETCLREERPQDALEWVSTCERTMRGLGAWVTPKGVEDVRGLRRMIEQSA